MMDEQAQNEFDNKVSDSVVDGCFYILAGMLVAAALTIFGYILLTIK